MKQRVLRRRGRRVLAEAVRYLRAQRARAEACLCERDADGWFDYWHTHVDWDGKANCLRGGVARHTFELLGLAESLTARRRGQVQAWATFCPDTADNAVFLHSANPNGNPFPHPFAGVAWGVAAPCSGIRAASAHEFGRFDGGEGTVYLCRARENGVAVQ